MASRAHVREASKKSFGCPSPTKDESNLCDRHAVGGIIHEPGTIVEHVPIQLLKVVLNSIYQGGGVIYELTEDWEKDNARHCMYILTGCKMFIKKLKIILPNNRCGHTSTSWQLCAYTYSTCAEPISFVRAVRPALYSEIQY